MEFEEPRDLSPQPSPQPSTFFGPVSLARAAVIFVVIQLECMQLFVLCSVHIGSLVGREDGDFDSGGGPTFLVTAFPIASICFITGVIWLAFSILAIVEARDFRGVFILLFVVCAWILVWTAFQAGLFQGTMSDAAMLGLHSISYISIVAIAAAIFLRWKKPLRNHAKTYGISRRNDY